MGNMLVCRPELPKPASADQLPPRHLKGAQKAGQSHLSPQPTGASAALESLPNTPSQEACAF